MYKVHTVYDGFTKNLNSIPPFCMKFFFLSKPIQEEQYEMR